MWPLSSAKDWIRMNFCLETTGIASMGSTGIDTRTQTAYLEGKGICTWKFRSSGNYMLILFAKKSCKNLHLCLWVLLQIFEHRMHKLSLKLERYMHMIQGKSNRKVNLI